MTGLVVASSLATAFLTYRYCPSLAANLASNLEARLLDASAMAVAAVARDTVSPGWWQRWEIGLYVGGDSHSFAAAGAAARMPEFAGREDRSLACCSRSWMACSSCWRIWVFIKQ